MALQAACWFVQTSPARLLFIRQKKYDSLLSCCFLFLVINYSVYDYLMCLTESAHQQADHPRTASSPPASQHISTHTAITTSMIINYVKLQNPLPVANKQNLLGLYRTKPQLCHVATSDSLNVMHSCMRLRHLKSHPILAGIFLHKGEGVQHQTALLSAINRQTTASYKRSNSQAANSTDG